MSYILARQVYEVDDLSRMDFNVLFHLAFAAAQDKDTVNIALENIVRKVRCSKRMVQYSLRRLESDGFLVPLGKPKGRGHILMYFVTVNPHVEPTPVVPPTNGHVPPPTNGHKPDVQLPPRDPYKPEPLTPEQIAARRAQWGAKRAEIAAKPRPEKKYDRPGRTERAATRMVSGETSLDGYPGGDASP